MRLGGPVDLGRASGPLSDDTQSGIESLGSEAASDTGDGLGAAAEGVGGLLVGPGGAVVGSVGEQQDASVLEGAGVGAAGADERVEVIAWSSVRRALCLAGMVGWAGGASTYHYPLVKGLSGLCFS